jgi:hypothetical protein
MHPWLAHRRRGAHGIAVLVAVLVLSLLGSSTVLAQSVDRPFRGSFATTRSDPAQPPAGCQLSLETGQLGQATHLGIFTGEGVTCGFNGTVTTAPPFNLAGGPPPYFVSDFTVEQTWTAADGSTLSWVSEDGVFVQSLADGSSSALGSMRIVGGTGRFAGATGHGQVVSNSTTSPGTTWDGTITFDAAD